MYQPLNMWLVVNITVDTLQSYNFMCIYQCLLRLLPLLAGAFIIMHIHVHDTCTHARAPLHACTSLVLRLSPTRACEGGRSHDDGRRHSSLSIAKSVE